MLHGGNVARLGLTRRGIIAASLLALAMTLIVSSRAVAEAPAGEQALQAPLLDGSNARQAHRLAETWVRQGAVPDALPEAIEVTDLFAARVTLRIAGYTMGIGDAVRPDAPAAVDAVGPPVDVVALVAQATGRAIDELRERLRDVRMRGVIEGRFDADRPAPTPADVGRRVLVDVQLARHPVTIRIPIDAPPAAVFGTFAGGFHGLRLVGPGAGAAMIWPASALAANTAPDHQLVQLLDAAGYGHDQVIELGRPVDGAPVFQRFKIIHVVRPRPGLPVMELVRGNVVLPPLSVSSRTLNSLADQLASHLQRQFITNGGVRGTYQPTSDRFDPAIAGDEDTAIACYALVRHGRLTLQRHPQDQVATMQAHTAYDTAVRLGLGALRAKPINLSPAAGAYILLTLADANLPDRANEDLRDELTRWLLGLRDEQGRPLDGAGAAAKPLNETRAAVVAAGLAAVYEQTRDPAVGEAVQQQLAALWSSAKSNPNPAALPWIVMAHTRAARLLVTEDDAQAMDTLRRRESVLGDLVDRLGRQQVIEPPLLGPADVVGGFQLYAGPAGSPPNPDWRTAHLLSFLSLCLADDAIAEGHSRFDWAITASLAARFIGQLMIDEPACYYMRNPEAALRGVRLALWNNQVAVGPNAIALLAVNELREATQTLREAVEQR